jgi:hypothetical protein
LEHFGGFLLISKELIYAVFMIVFIITFFLSYCKCGTSRCCYIFLNITPKEQ